jgi:aryl-alcohol dehydrogenase-like predicted oxidoreductase
MRHKMLERTELFVSGLGLGPMSFGANPGKYAAACSLDDAGRSLTPLNIRRRT